MSSDSAAIESTVRQRFSVVLDSSSTTVSSCAAWIGVYAAVAPTTIMEVWSQLMKDPNSDTDRRLGLLAVLHESLKSCARRGGADEVIRQFVFACRKEVPSAITSAISLESENSEFRRQAFQALTLWKTFTGFFRLQWLEETTSMLLNAGGDSSANTNMTNTNATSATTGTGVGGSSSTATSGADAAAASGSGSQKKDNVIMTGVSAAATSSGGGIAIGDVKIDSRAAEQTGFSQVARHFQKYFAALERLRQFESDPSASAAAVENVRDEVLRRAQPLLNSLGVSGGTAGFIPAIEAEKRRIQEQQQSNAAVAAEDAADPLEDFFS